MTRAVIGMAGLIATLAGIGVTLVPAGDDLLRDPGPPEPRKQRREDQRMELARDVKPKREIVQLPETRQQRRARERRQRKAGSRK